MDKSIVPAPALLAVGGRATDRNRPEADRTFPLSKGPAASAQSKKALSIGVIGYGYWGPNIVRNFHLQKDSQVSVVCDRRSEALAKVARAYPDMEVTSDPMQVIESPDIDIVAVVTPVWTHFDLAKAALENGKHVFVEKPFTSTSEQAEELIELAERKHLKIMVDHTFLFTGAVRKIKQLIDARELGELYYYDTTRVNLGLFQHDVNVIWDLRPTTCPSWTTCSRISPKQSSQPDKNTSTALRTLPTLPFTTRTS